MKVLITGGCGFIGHHFVEHILKNTDWDIIVFDKLTYASNGYDRLRDINCFDEKQVKIFNVDFTQPISEGIIKEVGYIDYIIHMGAETHVDNSILDPFLFANTNIIGTMHMLEYAKKIEPKCFYYFSTDEVFGPAPQGIFYKETDQIKPSNPYAAAKSGGECMVLAYANTYKIPYVITRTMNVFGERQHPEKFIPMTINKVLAKETVLIHGDKTKTISGQRCWIHARNVANAYMFIIKSEFVNDTFHIVGEELSNLDIAKKIAECLNKELKYEVIDFHSSRPGHDLRYAMSGDKLAKLGWQPPMSVTKSLESTINWFMQNELWLK